MLLGHLAPFGPIAVAVERRWPPQWPCWTRTLVWAAAFIGCIFPDFDILLNTLFNGVPRHLYYLPHSLLTYLPLLAVGIVTTVTPLARKPRTRLVGLLVLTFWLGVMSHLLLDAASHGTVLLYPLWNGLVGWTFSPIAGKSVLGAYFFSPNCLLEVGVLLAAGVWWLRRYVRGRRRRRLGAIFFRRGRGYLSKVPRHEGARLLRD